MKSRLDRQEETRQIKELNHTGKRIRWCRETLSLTIREVANASGMPLATYSNRENGLRTDLFEEYQALAQVFDAVFQDKFKGKKYPKFEQKEIFCITPSFLMFGKVFDDSDFDSAITEISLNFRQKEHDYLKKIDQLTKEVINGSSKNIKEKISR
jgi:transcriptional regulator with XRE-family HTH domain